MIFTTVKDSLKNSFEYFSRLPFTKSLLHRLNEKARGHSIVFFSLHRVLESSTSTMHHPHFLNRSAVLVHKAHSLLQKLNQRLPFISLADSLRYLQGKRSLHRSHAVLLIEAPYEQTVQLLHPLLEEMRIPATYILDTWSLEHGHMPWADEILYRLGTTNETEICAPFVDRVFALKNAGDRLKAARYFIENFCHKNPELLLSRMTTLREILSPATMLPSSERMATTLELEKIALNPLFSFASAGQCRLPFFDISLEDLEQEIVMAKDRLAEQFNRAFVPVFFNSFGADKKLYPDIMKILIDSEHQASISHHLGVARPGDHMFRLPRLSLAIGLKNFEQYELQGILDLIDEFLLVTLAQERELQR